MHFHRDAIAMCDCFPRYFDMSAPDDVFAGTPPLAFTFGLGGLTAFPMRFGASTRFFPGPVAPEEMMEAVERYRITSLYTAPTAYRVMADIAGRHDLSSLVKCVSAGETLPKATWEAFHAATGIPIVDGLGSTEMLHIFVRRRARGDARGLHRARDSGIPGACRGRDGQRPAQWRARADGGARSDRLPLPRRCRPSAGLCPGRLELPGRRVCDGGGRVFPLRRARRRHDHLVRLQHLGAGGRGGAARSPRRRRVRGDRQARYGAYQHRQGRSSSCAEARGRARKPSSDYRTS